MSDFLTGAFKKYWNKTSQILNRKCHLIQDCIFLDRKFKGLVILMFLYGRVAVEFPPKNIIGDSLRLEIYILFKPT